MHVIACSRCAGSYCLPLRTAHEQHSGHFEPPRRPTSPGCFGHCIIGGCASAGCCPYLQDLRWGDDERDVSGHLRDSRDW